MGSGPADAAPSTAPLSPPQAGTAPNHPSTATPTPPPSATPLPAPPSLPSVTEGAGAVSGESGGVGGAVGVAVGVAALLLLGGAALAIAAKRRRPSESASVVQSTRRSLLTRQLDTITVGSTPPPSASHSAQPIKRARKVPTEVCAALRPIGLTAEEEAELRALRQREGVEAICFIEGCTRSGRAAPTTTTPSNKNAIRRQRSQTMPTLNGVVPARASPATSSGGNAIRRQKSLSGQLVAKTPVQHGVAFVPSGWGSGSRV